MTAFGSTALPLCPYLPSVAQQLDWRHVHRFRRAPSAEFPKAALEYAQSLWLEGHPARAILLIDRALFAATSKSEPPAKQEAQAYQAMRWVLERFPSDSSAGNPRVHFQHLADRVRGPFREVKQWRAWACWALTRQARPEFPGDPRHAVPEPTLEAIADGLKTHGWAGEVAVWRRALGA
ncbi:MAG: hypothetical protein ACFB20_04460 [Opitutales bacterium]